MKRSLKGLFACCLVLATFACGGGSSGGGTVLSQIQAGFVPEEPTPGAGTVALSQGATTNDLITLQVGLTGVDGVYGAAFDLLFDPAMADFVDWSAGSILEDDGHEPIYLVDVPQSGRLVVVATRKGIVPGIDVSGTRNLMSLRFRVTEIGGNPLEFQAQELFDDQLQSQRVATVDWRAGTLVGE